jgi:hypothetical protein
MAVSSSEVLEIFGGADNTDITDFSTYIAIATTFVNGALGTTAIDDAVRDDITLYMSAYFASITEPKAFREKIGDAEEEKTVKSFLDVAIMLDPTGKVKQAALPKRRAFLEHVD